MSIIIHSKFSGYFFKSLTSVLVLVLTGLSPPRKSAASVCMWQLMEDRSLPSREANKWQRVVLPHLSYNEAKEISRILNVMIGTHNLPQAGEINIH